MLDDDAVKATQRLNQRGFEAYLVGGCVRDLLLGLRPKDYDIATEARPQQVKRTFPRNCRIIGRRFKLAHLHFHANTKILEVSTFRRSPQMDNADDDLLIRHDNEFGTAEEDALRRDFTVNALFLDPLRDRILDYTTGLQDLQSRTIRTIGDPRVRFREDPVRILRAAKFAGRLGFQVDPDTLAAMAEVAPDLVRAAPPRLFEEILRLLRSGHALDSFQLLRDVGALKSLLPVVADFLAAAPQAQRVLFWRLLEALDHRVHEGHVPPSPVLLGVVMTMPVQVACEQQPTRSPSTIAEELLGPFSQTLRLPRRDTGCLKRICGVQHRFQQTGEQQRFRVQGFVHGPYFDEALELFALRAHAAGIDEALVVEWRSLSRGAGPRDHRGDDPAIATHDAEADSADGPQGVEGDGSDDGNDRPPAAAADDVDAAVPDGAPFGGGDGDGDGQPRRRRRRRGRRGRRGRGSDPDSRLPEAPADGTPPDSLVPADSSGLPPDEAGESDQDVAASRADEGADHDRQPHVADAASAGEANAANDESGPGDAHSQDGASGDRRRRRRRRRGGRGRNREGGGQHPHAPDQRQPAGHEDVALPGEEQSSAGTAPEAPHTTEPQHQQQRPQRHQQQRPRRAADAPSAPPRDRHHDAHGRGGDDRQGGRRGRRRGRDRDRGRGHSRDVDVVPRGVDRRGKVDVIEPKPLDLTAFDIELDPKRVPTFGSIVEGKGRPKRRPPRLPDEGKDDYRPPPPPGGEPGPGGAPPPPPPSEPDTFGDW